MIAARAERLVVIGVSGVGKSTIAALLAESLNVELIDADDLHSEAAIEKMRGGTPLDDEDRMPWLERCGRALAAAQGGAVLACSALARRYRATLSAEAPEARFVHLVADRDSIARRLGARDGHFMPPTLLDSQLVALEPLGSDEPGITVDADRDSGVVLADILVSLDL